MQTCPICQHRNRSGARFCSQCRAPLWLQSTYRITRLLGRGGYGAVYQAQQTHLGNVPCAIKELQPDPKATPQQIQKAAEQFQLEASLLAGLHHPALPRVTNFFAEGGRYYLVMDYVEGETLEERLERNGGPLPEAQVLAWADELCDVLMYLHTRQPSPVIHRDVKPANVKITPDGKLNLIDFGISKVLAKGTGDAARAVSPPYSPLEQYGKGVSTDARSDIYALGVTLYQLLTNHLPPHAPDRPNEALIPPRQLNPAVSPMTESVILKAIEEKPAERYQSAEEMKRAFKTPPTNPFVFRGGGQARDLQELVRLCEAKPQDAIWHLESGHFEPWLTAIGRPDLTRAANTIKQQTGTSPQRLKWFLDATGLPHTYIAPPQPPPPPPPPLPPPPPSPGCNKWGWLVLMIVVGAVSIWIASGLGLFPSVPTPAPTAAPPTVPPATKPPEPTKPPVFTPPTDKIGVVTIKPADPIVIAYWFVVAGANASLGTDTKRGIEIAIDDKGGKLLDRPIKLIGQDSGCNAEGGQAAATKLAADPTIVVAIGSNCSSAARPGAPILWKAGIATISPSNTAPFLTEPGRGPGYDGYLRTAPNDRVQGAVAAQFAYTQLKVTKAATVHNGSPCAEALQAVFAETFKKLGGTITSQEAVSIGTTDMRPVLTKIAAGKPEFIYYPIFIPEGAQITSQARKVAGLEKVILMGADGMFSPDFYKAAGEAAVGMFHSSPDFTAFAEGYKAFLDKHQKKYGEKPLELFHVHAYDAAMMAFAAIEKVAVKGPDGTLYIGRQALRDALYATKGFKGLTGTLNCDQYGDCADPKIAIYLTTADNVKKLVLPSTPIWKPY